MKNLRSLLDGARANTEKPPGEGHGRRHHTLAVTGAVVFHRYLCLQYVVTPVPRVLRAESSLHEGDAGIAIGDHGTVYGDCSSAYRRSADGSRVIGALKISPALRPGTSRVRVLFPPLAHTPGLDQALCEVELKVDSDRVEPISIRWA
jgi:hypothetical protein